MVIFSLLFPLLIFSAFAHGQGVHDYDLPEVRLLQQARGVLAPMPSGFDGRPDWVRGLKNRQIEPRETLWGGPREPEAWGDAPVAGIIFSNTRYMPYVVFPHQAHTEWLSCSNCHDAIFPRKKTGALKGMTAIFQGEFCGVCHGRVAFSPEGSCYRCHSMPNPAAILQNSPFVEPTKVEVAPAEVEEEKQGWFRGRNKAPPPAGLRPAPRITQ